MSTTGSTAPSAKLLAAALCVAFAGCSAAAVTPNGSAFRELGAQSLAATSTTVNVFIPAHQRRPKVETLGLFAKFDGPPLVEVPLTGSDCRTARGTVACSGSFRLTPGRHAFYVRVLNVPEHADSSIFVTIADCKANAINLAMYETRVSALSVKLEDLNVEIRPGGYFGPFGSAQFAVNALDSRGYTIVGPRAPTISAASSNRKIAALFVENQNHLDLALDGEVPFDRMFHSRITLSSGSVQRRFTFKTEFTTWPTATPSPTPAPCS